MTNNQAKLIAVAILLNNMPWEERMEKDIKNAIDEVGIIFDWIEKGNPQPAK